jgi:hypothetical protein
LITGRDFLLSVAAWYINVILGCLPGCESTFVDVGIMHS